MRFVLLAVAMLAASPALAASAPKESWGKAGVPLDEFRADSLACGMKAYGPEFYESDAARALLDGTRQIDEVMEGFNPDLPTIAAARIAKVQAEVKPEQKLKQLKALQAGLLTVCLTDRGYQRFKLTSAQRRAIGKLKKGSDERRAYLHSLASDPAVLANQPV